jgi:arginine exporter protein ArgO
MTTLRKHLAEIIMVGSIIYLGVFGMMALNEARQHNADAEQAAIQWGLKGTK